MRPASRLAATGIHGIRTATSDVMTAATAASPAS
jgi:hypothetical protein